MAKYKIYLFMKVWKVIFLSLIITGMITSCFSQKPSSTETISSTATPTIAPTAIQKSTNTPTPTQDPTPSALLLIRPVPKEIPLYHWYGDNNPNYEGFHPGYDYGFNNCTPIKQPIIAMGDGTIIRTDVDDPHPAGKNGAVRIDYGVHQLQNGEINRIIGQFGHIIPLVSVGDIVDAETIVAEFSTCERYGYSPELEIKIYVLDVNQSEQLFGYSLDQYLARTIDEGNNTAIDPLLVGLEPK